MKRSYHIITIGCQMNVSDSERIAALLESYDFKNEPNRARAGLVILNTCGVRQSAENRVYGLIANIRKENFGGKIILAGCLALRPDVQRRLKNFVDFWLPITKLPELPNLLDLENKKSTAKEYLSIAPKVAAKFSAYLPIGNGCDNFCAYCVVPFARGREQYRAPHEIIAEAKKFIAQGYEEIFLIAQNVNSYKFAATRADLSSFSGKKIGELINFPELLQAVNDLTGDFWIRFATSHPKDMSDELIKVIARGKKITPYVHLPIQAGDDQTLQAMNRKYTVKHYLSLIAKIRKAIPDAAISTDVIVGFPGETKKQFNNTVKLMEKVKFDMAYLAQYSPRPGTAAFKLKDNVPAAEKKRREQILADILKKTAWENNKKFLNKQTLVLLERKNKKGEWIGKNPQYKTVKVGGAAAKNLAGEFVRVKINEVKDFGLTGRLIK